MKVLSQLERAQFENASTAPDLPAKGMVYFDTGLGRSRVYNGTIWEDLSTASVVQSNGVISGRMRTTSAQPCFLVPSGSVATATVKAGSSNPDFTYYIDSVKYTISADTAITSLASAPSSNNTALLSNSLNSNQWSKYCGEDGSVLNIGTVGSEISGRAGQWASFKIVNGGSTEYFFAFIKTTAILAKVHRGYFFKSDDTPHTRIALSTGHTITLMRTHYIFAKSDGTLTNVSDANSASSTPVSWGSEPSSPTSGDYWFDSENDTWKRYNGSAWVSAGATLIGIACVDSSGVCQGARSVDFAKTRSGKLSLSFSTYTASTVTCSERFGAIEVDGNEFLLGPSKIKFDMTTDLESGEAEAASTVYWLYITETGARKISTVKPWDRRGDLGGYYHPHNSWRAVAIIANNSSSDLVGVTDYTNQFLEGRMTTLASWTLDSGTYYANFSVYAATGALNHISSNGDCWQVPVSGLYFVEGGAQANDATWDTISYYNFRNDNTQNSIEGGSAQLPVFHGAQMGANQGVALAGRLVWLPQGTDVRLGSTGATTIGASNNVNNALGIRLIRICGPRD